MDENLTSHASYRISGTSALVCRVITIRDRMPRFHKDSRNPRVSPDIAMQHKMNPTRTNAYENERKRTSRGGPYPPTTKVVFCENSLTVPPHRHPFNGLAG